jgi:hypothetical protein
MTEKELARETLDWVTLRELNKRSKDLKEEARRAVEKAADAGDTPLSIARKTGIPKGRVALWMMLNRHPESPS